MGLVEPQLTSSIYNFWILIIFKLNLWKAQHEELSVTTAQRFPSSIRETRHLWGNSKRNSLTLGKAVCLWAREALSNLPSPTGPIAEQSVGAEEPLTTVFNEVYSVPLGDSRDWGSPRGMKWVTLPNQHNKNSENRTSLESKHTGQTPQAKTNQGDCRLN